jgi:hypothetical protein
MWRCLVSSTYFNKCVVHQVDGLLRIRISHYAVTNSETDMHFYWDFKFTTPDAVFH